MIADAARSMPHTLRSMRLADNELTELAMHCGFDQDLAGQIAQIGNRIRDLLTHHREPRSIVWIKCLTRQAAPGVSYFTSALGGTDLIMVGVKANEN